MNGYYSKDKRTKRYVLLFNEWWRQNRRGHDYTWHFNPSWHEYDTLEEAMEEVKLINEVYSPQLIPFSEKVPHDDFWDDGEGDITNGGKWWGYALLDYEREKVVKSGGKGYLRATHMKPVTMKSNKDLYFLDEYFCGPSEVPKDYDWDDGEYEGWLQFRWGDGKNAIGYTEPKKGKPVDKPEAIEEPEVEEEDLVEEEILKRKGWG